MLLKKAVSKLINYQLFLKSFLKYRSVLRDDNRFSCNWSDRLLILGEDTATTEYDAHYVFHTSWAARILAQVKPQLHVDISSDLRFVTIVSSFIPIDFYDYRPVEFSLSGLKSKQGDLMALPLESNSIMSLSCMHVVEHIGLQRYGDPLDSKGDIKAMIELERVLAVEGQLFFVVPIGGVARIQYNAHRIYTFDMIIKQFQKLKLESFALVTDEGTYIQNATENQANIQKYGCGCFLFKK